MEKILVLTGRAFPAMIFAGGGFFIGGAWLTSDTLMTIGVYTFFASAVPMAVCLSLMVADALRG